jgi:hypothetical protein
VVANATRSGFAAAAAGHGPHGTAAQVKAVVVNHALAVGFSRGFLVSAGIALLALLVTIAIIRVKKEDLAGVELPMGG